MKTSVLASVLFSTIALAAPVDKRAYATKTEVAIEYYTVYTTVTGAQPAAAPTSDPALFYEAPSSKTTATTTSVNTPPPPPPAPTTTQAPPPPKPTVEDKPKPAPTSVYTPPPPPPVPTTTEAPPAPKPTTQAPPPPPPSTQAAPAPQPTQPSGGSGGSGGGEVHSGGSYTMNRYQNGLGACGEKINDKEFVVALAVDVFGEATVDFMTGKTNNPWCNKKIEVTNNGRTHIATIMDRCEGCTNGGLDATPALWDATTGGLGDGSGDRIYSMSWKVIE